jgi:hypothetical protein
VNDVAVKRSLRPFAASIAVGLIFVVVVAWRSHQRSVWVRGQRVKQVPRSGLTVVEREGSAFIELVFDSDPTVFGKVLGRLGLDDPWRQLVIQIELTLPIAVGEYTLDGATELVHECGGSRCVDWWRFHRGPQLAPEITSVRTGWEEAWEDHVGRKQQLSGTLRIDHVAAKSVQGHLQLTSRGEIESVISTDFHASDEPRHLR